MKKGLVVLVVFFLACSFVANRSEAGPGLPAPGVAFLTPAEPPTSRYVIDVKIGAGGSTTEGRETISLENSGRLPIAVVALDWDVSTDASLEVSLGGARLFPSDPPAGGPVGRPILVPLPSPLAPGSRIELKVIFASKVVLPKGKSDFVAAAERRLAFGWKAKDAPELYDLLKAEPVTSAEIWYELGLGLYGADRLDDAEDCFTKIDASKADPYWTFGGQGWLGIIDDLKGHRDAAVAHYRAAMAIAPARPLRHDQFHVTLDKPWLEEWIRKPFTRDSLARVPETPTASQLSDVINAIGWEDGGDTPILVYGKAAGTTVTDAGFWFRLGLLLFEHDRESLDAFSRSSALEKEGARAFASRIWQGHLNDLFGNRAAAIDAYKEALAIDPGLAYRHDQWKLVLDRAYVEKCLTTPFVRR